MRLSHQYHQRGDPRKQVVQKGAMQVQDGLHGANCPSQLPRQFQGRLRWFLQPRLLLAAVPTPEPAWIEKKGCCRQVDGKIKYSHHGTATTKIISATLFSAAAVECKEQCDENCTAAEHTWAPPDSQCCYSTVLSSQYWLRGPH